MTSGEHRERAGSRTVVQAVRFSPDGKSFLFVTTRAIVTFDTRTGRQVRSRALGTVHPDHSFALSDDCRFLAYHEGDNALQVMDLRSGKVAPLVESHGSTIDRLVFSPDGKSLASRSWHGRGSLRLWEARTGKQLRCWDGRFHLLRFSPDGKQIVTAAVESGVASLTIATRKTTTVSIHGASELCALSNDGKLLAAVVENRLAILDASNGKVLGRNDLWVGGMGREFDIGSAVFSPDGRKLLVFLGNARGSDEKTPPSLLVVDSNSGKSLRQFGPSMPLSFPVLWVPPMAWAPDCRHIAIREGSELLLLDPERDRVIWKWALKRPIRGLAFSSDGRWIVTKGRDCAVDLHEAHSGAIAWTFAGHRGYITSLAFSPDGRSFATGATDCTALVWDLFATPFGGRKLIGDEAERLWRSLASRDTAAAFKAMRSLAGDREQAARLLGPRLRKVPAPVPAKQLARLIVDLDADEYSTRERASAELARLGGDIEPSLRKARAAKPSLELARRLDRLLRACKPSAEGLRASRAVAVLEYTRTPDALALLRDLARDAAHPVLQAEARAAVARLSR